MFKGSLMNNKNLDINQIIDILYKRKQYFKGVPPKWEKYKKGYLKKFKSCVRRMKFRLRKVNFNHLLAKHLHLPKNFRKLKKKVLKLRKLDINVVKKDSKHQKMLQELYKELFSWHSEYPSIAKFFLEFLKILIPKDIFGHKQNYQKINVFIRKFIALKRYETLHYDILCNQFNYHKIPWLKTKEFNWIHPSKKR